MAKEAVLWTRDEHTKAKHELLRAFFNKWISIHSGYFASRPGGGLVRIYDGFAGPGVYAGGGSGSPLILMRALCTNPNLHERWSPVRYDLHFVEKNEARADILASKLQEFEDAMRDRGPGWSDRVQWTVTCGRYEEHVPQAVSEPSALFLFLDPFGYSHAPMELTKDLVQQPKSDTLIFLPLSFVNRFKNRPGQETALDRFFGTSTWRDVLDGPQRPSQLLSLFEKQLRDAALEWVGSFRLKPDPSNAYFIVGGSGHPKGWSSIKEGFWSVDPVNGQGYVAPKPVAAGQQRLDFGEPEGAQPNTSPLLDALRARFGGEPFTVEAAMELTARSRFLDTHLKTKTLAPAEKTGDLVVTRPPGVRLFKEGKGITMRFDESSEP
ncbi:MAG: three-Cys-motif partner protein TcmP [Solirubrobacteraceae bacterium]